MTPLLAVENLRITFPTRTGPSEVVRGACDRLMVMQFGQKVEDLTRDDLQSHRATMDYTNALLTASAGYSRKETTR